MGEYILMFVLTAIPIVNVICWIVWLCSANTNKNKKNYIIASIVMWAIGVAVVIVLAIVAAVTGISLGGLYY